MKDQRFPSQDDLKAAFSKRKAEDDAWFSQTGVNTLVESLSRAIRDLNEAGIDARLELIGNASEDAFAMVGHISSIKDKGMIVPISGIVKIGETRHLLAVSVKEAGADVLKLYVSSFDYDSQGAKPADIRGEVYDCQNDPKAMEKFQKSMIFTAARNEVLREHDIAESFGLEKRQVFRLTKPEPGHP